MKTLKQYTNEGWSILVLIFTMLLCLGVMSRQPLPHGDASSTSLKAVALTRLPAIVLWAWERPERLDFIDPQKVAVAFLGKTISLRRDGVTVRPRLHPLTVPAGTKMIAVVRIESDRSQLAALSDADLSIVVGESSEMACLPNVVAVQLDFDATRSEREFYRKAIFRLREKLPPSMPLSITALASWCWGDDWLSALPIDEAVPMLFRMGIDRRQILSQLESGATFNSIPCRASAGVSVDEPLSPELLSDRLYIFSPKAWSGDSFKAAMEIYHR